MNTIIDTQAQIRQYILITGNYWAFTLTDGALRMLVVLYFHQLGYAPLDIALLFIFYEAFGVVTNLVGGWLGARLGLNKTMNLGLFLQIVALSLLLVPASYLTVAWVMAAQALSGIAKDLNKMSAKSAIKLLVPSNKSGRLFKWVALLTGSKNTLKGVGFFLGGLLLSVFEFRGAILIMAVGLLLVWGVSVFKLKRDIGRSRTKPKFTTIFSKNKSINTLSAARMFLFGARDVWFVVALPVWVILYGVVQAFTPKLLNRGNQTRSNSKSVITWALLLSMVPFLIAFSLLQYQWPIQTIIVGGLLVFGGLFAINSALHSFLIVQYASADSISLDVGFYYMANAMGRLLGTVLSGLLYQLYGLEICLIFSGVFILIAAFVSLNLEKPPVVSTPV